MPETVITSFAGWLLIAATGYRLRPHSGVATPATVRALRLAGAALLAAALLRCGTGLTGERIVRFLGGASLAGVALVALLSVAPAATLRPVSATLRRWPVAD